MGNNSQLAYFFHMEERDELAPFLFFAFILGVLAVKSEYNEVSEDEECMQECSS